LRAKERGSDGGQHPFQQGARTIAIHICNSLKKKKKKKKKKKRKAAL